VRELLVKGESSTSKILIGESFLNLKNYIDIDKTVIITDLNLYAHYKDNFPACKVIVIQTGEGIKTLDTANYIYEKFLEYGVDRSCFIIGIGGGIVCDITGFVASTFLRGVNFGFVSTSLLSQVDASTGGKNGVNFSGFKNMIGVFNQPSFVIIDFKMLATLPVRELLSGYGEIVKHSLIGNYELFTFLEDNYKNTAELDDSVLEKVVYDSLKIKTDIVSKDERESGERRKLNFGHTFGHAVEKITREFTHGEAVSLGIVVAAQLSLKKDLISEDDVNRIVSLLENLGLPIKITTDKHLIFDALKKDKKREGNFINFVLINKIGNAIIEPISLADLEEVVNDLY